MDIGKIMPNLLYTFEWDALKKKLYFHLHNCLRMETFRIAFYVPSELSSE